MAKKNPNHKPWQTESSGLDGYFKSEAWAAFAAAEPAMKDAESYLLAQTALPADVAAGFQQKFQAIAMAWQNDFDKVKGYSEKWTRWLKYINLGEEYGTQFRLLKLNVQDAVAGLPAAKSGAVEKVEKKIVKADASTSTPPALAASEDRANGDNAGVPKLPFFSDPIAIAMVSGGVLLAAAVVWALWPEKKTATAGLGRYRRSYRRRRSLRGWSRENPSIDWRAVEERASNMTTAQLRHAIADIKATIPHSRSLDREDKGDREGWYTDEMHTYLAELKRRTK